MPISRATFIKGETDDSYDQRVTQFLLAHQDQAFTSEEIWTVLNGPGRPKTLGQSIIRGLAIGALTNQLDRLAREGRIQRRTVRTRNFDKNYYSARIQ
jgi:DNA-binding HxlR family transcriptional regulator